MTTFPYLISLIIILVSLCKTKSEDFTCGTTSCGTFGLPIRFPFSTNQPNQTNLCSYPGFELTCSNTSTTTIFSEPLLTLPNSETFAVKHISFIDQTVWVNDPNKCLPKHFMFHHHHDFMLNLKDSPFRLSDYYSFVNVSFLKCPSNSSLSSMVPPMSCLNLDYPVVAMRSDPPFGTPWILCEFITSAMVPVEDTNGLFWNDYYSNIPLQWDNPDCGACEERGGRCGLVGEDVLRLACYGLPAQGISKKLKYGLSMGLAIPALLGIIVLTWMLWNNKNTRNQAQQQRETGTEFSTMVMPHPPVLVMGLDMATIDRYPKTQLGESGRLPRPNDNVCSICLCEYQPNEVLRTIPECNHYFHANCIDGWLKTNATCPLCRNFPEMSSFFASVLPVSPTS
ncbi:RING-H2 finger protein ATL20 [Lathyrus oleraceus]|uniref:RING-type E3 ubiquitin transferase n=1 Tax=Pisum sativum TaxID=3888 RepID=A0A9D4VGX5_PEA|nr:RING-H2 finger protein ATL20-like [Pisum sativum]KAI5383430.1 hypothetical protein KIW84_070722 [Pisum sativum]